MLLRNLTFDPIDQFPIYVEMIKLCNHKDYAQKF